MNYRLCRTALAFAVAGQSLVAPVARIPCDYVRPITAIVQRVSDALLTSPRWGSSLDRLGGRFEVTISTYSRSPT